MKRISTLMAALFILGNPTFGASETKPQDPKPPLPYSEEEVTFTSEDGEVELSGTLTLPLSVGPHPAVYLIPGGSPFDRNQDMRGHKTFLVLADHLTRLGIAVLRVDDRGIGASTGEKMTSSMDELAGDVI
jgi:hypothetical protein